MVDFDALWRSVVAWPAELVTGIFPPPEIRIDRYSECNIALSPIPEVRPRPKSTLDGADRILNAFDGLPIVPGQVDVAFDPIAKLLGRPVLAFRVNGYVWTGLIESYPDNGSVLGEWLKSAHLNRSGFSRASFAAETLLRGLTPEVTEGICNRGLTQNLDLISGEGLRYRVLTVPEHTRKTWNIDLVLQAMELGQNLLMTVPVGGGASAEPQARMLERLPLPMRDAVLRDLLELPNVPRAVMTYGSSYPARIGLLQLQKMPRGFEVPAEPASPPVVWAGLWGSLLALLGLRGGRTSSPASATRPTTPGRPVRQPTPVEGVAPIRRPSGARPAGHPDTAPFQAEPVGHRPSRSNVPIARGDPQVTAPGAMQGEAVQLRLSLLRQQVGSPVRIALRLSEIEGILPEEGRGGIFAIVKRADGTFEVRVAERGDAERLLLEGDHRNAGGSIPLGRGDSLRTLARIGGMKDE